MRRPYCLIGMGDIKGIKEDLQFISETESNFVCGDSLIIATFMSTLRIIEIEEFFNMNDRAYILFELTPGFFAANLQNPKFQRALFGDVTHVNTLLNGEMEDTLKEFINNIEEDLGELNKAVGSTSIIKDPTLDEILDKISELGIENLTIKEKEILKNYSTEKNI